MKIEIKCRFTGNVLFTHEAEENTLRLTLEAAVSARANLARANLAGANLVGANLVGADLDGANLAGANLAGADLAGANLAGADLAGANLAGANLAGADLAGAYLAGANLVGANLVGANLAGADLDGEVLTKAPLSLLNLQWSVLVTSQYMRIGCQRHTHEEWAAFDDDAISDMSSGALDFWNQWKGVLLEMCKKHKGEA